MVALLGHCPSGHACDVLGPSLSVTCSPLPAITLRMLAPAARLQRGIQSWQTNRPEGQTFALSAADSAPALLSAFLTAAWSAAALSGDFATLRISAALHGSTAQRPLGLLKKTKVAWSHMHACMHAYMHASPPAKPGRHAAALQECMPPELAKHMGA